MGDGTLFLEFLLSGAWQEADYQTCACADYRMEIPLASGARADCASDTHAIEVESYSDWAEGIGQSLHYADELGLQAQLVMFCETNEKRCYRESLRLESTIANHALPISVVDAADLGCVPKG